MKPYIAIVQEAEEQTLVRRAAEAVSNSDWIVGECASLWCQRYARGRTDADFAALIDMGAESVAQRRRVWETFADVRESYPGLTFSHFRSACSWNDAAEMLQWAMDQQANDKEMVAYRRMLHVDQGAERSDNPHETVSLVDPSEPEEVHETVPAVADRDSREAKHVTEKDSLPRNHGTSQPAATARKPSSPDEETPAATIQNAALDAIRELTRELRNRSERLAWARELRQLAAELESQP